jgi:hypothetical protein
VTVNPPAELAEEGVAKPLKRDTVGAVYDRAPCMNQRNARSQTAYSIAFNVLQHPHYVTELSCAEASVLTGVSCDSTVETTRKSVVHNSGVSVP